MGNSRTWVLEWAYDPEDRLEHRAFYTGRWKIKRNGKIYGEVSHLPQWENEDPDPVKIYETWEEAEDDRIKLALGDEIHWSVQETPEYE